MRGLIKSFDHRTQTGIILFGVDIEFTFCAAEVKGAVILQRGDEVCFDVRDRGMGEEAFDVQLAWNVARG